MREDWHTGPPDSGLLLERSLGDAGLSGPRHRGIIAPQFYTRRQGDPARGADSEADGRRAFRRSFDAEARSGAPWPATFAAARGGAERWRSDRCSDLSARPFKSFEVVDGEEPCAGATIATRKERRASAPPQRLRVNSGARTRLSKRPRHGDGQCRYARTALHESGGPVCQSSIFHLCLPAYCRSAGLGRSSAYD
jgi:hypothetical protein